MQLLNTIMEAVKLQLTPLQCTYLQQQRPRGITRNGGALGGGVAEMAWAPYGSKLVPGADAPLTHP